MCLLCGKKQQRCLIEEKRRLLLSYIQQEKWDRLLNELEGSKKFANRALLGHALLTLQELIGRNALHVICCLHPPVAVVEAILEICPSSVEGVDKNGYTPLHVAAEWGASPQVIDCLIDWYPLAALTKERKGKTPLHLCCETCCLEGTCDTGVLGKNYVKGPLRQVLKSLIKAAPLSVNDEDFEGMSPLEISINCGADGDVVRTLQRASEEAWNNTKQKRIYENASKRNQLTSVENSQYHSLPGQQNMTNKAGVPGQQNTIRKVGVPKTQNLTEYVVCGKLTQSKEKNKIFRQMKEGLRSKWSKAA
jgi:ankyrin repeat protein